MGSYEFIDHTADVLWQATGNDLAEVFTQCALALQETQVSVKNIEEKQEIVITGENKNIEYLLFDFLDDLLLYKDRDQLVFHSFQITVTEKEGKFVLNCIAKGEVLDVKKHDPRVDVKAITMHEFSVKKVSDGWKAQVLVDI
ncbi:archease [Candidatus Woesearchaeota archaeon]|nr:archease [Candidatus Woesearchaeota archaeon]